MENLKFVKELRPFNVYFIYDLEIDPFANFSTEFSAEYWYLKYHLLRDGKIMLDKDFYQIFLEDSLNIIFFKITDLVNFSVECTDGEWYFKILKENQISIKVYEELKASNLI